MLPDSLVVTNVDKIINDCWNLREIYIPRGAGIKATKDYEKLMGPWYLRLDGCNRIEKITAPHISCEQIAEKRVLAALWGYLCSPEIYCEHVVEDYQQSCFKFRKKLLPKLYTEDNVDGLRIFANTGKITLKNIDKDFLEPALVAGATQCVAFLLNLKNECTTSSKTPPRTNSIIKSTENKKKSVSPEERMLKKLWGFEEKNNKIRLLTYKGEETTVIIPAHIGQSAVAVIARGAFTGTYGHGSNRRERAISEIVSIEIQDGVREIQGAAFRWCNNLEMIKIPKSVKKIATYRFDETRKKLLSEPAFMGCPKLTIYAPAGSYAETYAKDNNIPFVAE
jgi:hypothetical protein